jgi:hypothetical protein
MIKAKLTQATMQTSPFDSAIYFQSKIWAFVLLISYCMQAPESNKSYACLFSTLIYRFWITSLYPKYPEKHGRPRYRLLLGRPGTIT